MSAANATDADAPALPIREPRYTLPEAVEILMERLPRSGEHFFGPGMVEITGHAMSVNRLRTALQEAAEQGSSVRTEVLRVNLRKCAERLTDAANAMDSALIEPEWDLFENHLAVARLELARLEELVAGPSAGQ